MNNIYISYDLIAPNKNYDKIINAIKELGNYAKIHKSFWYVQSEYSAEKICNHLNQFIDSDDKLYVLDSTNNNAAWSNISQEVTNHIKKSYAFA